MAGTTIKQTTKLVLSVGDIRLGIMCKFITGRCELIHIKYCVPNYPYPVNIFGPENVSAISAEAAGYISFTDRAAIGIDNAIGGFIVTYLRCYK